MFGSLDTLILRANAATLEELELSTRDVLARSRASNQPPLERLVSLAFNYVDFAEAHPLSWSAVFEFPRPANDDLPDFYRERTCSLFRLIEEAIADLPELDEAAARQEFARAMWAALHGILALAFADRLGPVNRDNVRRHVEIVVRTAASGLGVLGASGTVSRA